VTIGTRSFGSAYCAEVHESSTQTYASNNDRRSFSCFRASSVSMITGNRPSGVVIIPGGRMYSVQKLIPIGRMVRRKRRGCILLKICWYLLTRTSFPLGVDSIYTLEILWRKDKISALDSGWPIYAIRTEQVLSSLSVSFTYTESKEERRDPTGLDRFH
jgi:hypothetical protein